MQCDVSSLCGSFVTEVSKVVQKNPPPPPPNKKGKGIVEPRLVPFTIIKYERFHCMRLWFCDISIFLFFLLVSEIEVVIGGKTRDLHGGNLIGQGC